MIKVNKDWLTRQTGDPFVDTGGWVIQWCWEQPYLKDKTILELIEWVSKVYVNNWRGKLNSFFLNSAITNPANSGKEITETIRYFRSLIDETADNQIGTCRILGEKTNLFLGGRHNVMLSGSGAFLNFHHGFQSGLMLSKEAIIRLFFVPFGSQVVGGLNVVLSANLPNVEKKYVWKICQQNERRIGSSDTEGGVLKSNLPNPANALFDFAREYIEKYDDEDETIEMNLYHYTNFAAKPEINLYCFSSTLFEFYRAAMKSKYKKDWQRFAHSFYRQKGALYQDANDVFALTEKKETRQVVFDDFQTWYNALYDKLLRGENIRIDFANWSHRQYETKKSFHIFYIVKLYQKHFSDMNDKALEKIEEIAEFVVSDTDKLKKRMTKLRNAKHEGDVRAFLLDLIEAKKEGQPLVRLREYTSYLFPDGTFGAVIRDLLLISIYEKLSDKNQFVELETESIS